MEQLVLLKPVGQLSDPGSLPSSIAAPRTRCRFVGDVKTKTNETSYSRKILGVLISYVTHLVGMVFVE